MAQFPTFDEDRQRFDPFGKIGLLYVLINFSIDVKTKKIFWAQEQ